MENGIPTDQPADTQTVPEVIADPTPARRYAEMERRPPMTFTYSSLGQPENQRINTTANVAMVTPTLPLAHQPVPMFNPPHLQPAIYPYIYPMTWPHLPMMQRPPVMYPACVPVY